LINVDSADVIALMGVYCIVSCEYARTALEGGVTVLYRTSVQRRKEKRRKGSIVNSPRGWGRMVMWISPLPHTRLPWDPEMESKRTHTVS